MKIFTLSNYCEANSKTVWYLLYSDHNIFWIFWIEWCHLNIWISNASQQLTESNFEFIIFVQKHFINDFINPQCGFHILYHAIGHMKINEIKFNKYNICQLLNINPYNKMSILFLSSFYLRALFSIHVLRFYFEENKNKIVFYTVYLYFIIQ